MKTPTSPSIAQIHRVLQHRFHIKLEDCFVQFELIRRDTDPKSYDRTRANFVKQLKSHPRRDEIRRRSYFGESFGIYLQGMFPRAEVEGLPPDLTFHYPICTFEEIRRIESLATAADYLLKLRADAIADSPRLKRVFLRRREKNPQDWSLTGHFASSAFSEYLATLPDDKRALCTDIPAGMAFLREPNGLAVKSPHGTFIVISEALKSYLYYMNVFLLAQGDISDADRFGALTIALRSMFLTEALDFDLDPRGALPSELHWRIQSLVAEQLQFVIGHEYSHLVLGHLEACSTERIALQVVPGNDILGARYYTPLQKQEFAADVGSLLNTALRDQDLGNRLIGATWFFLGLEILYSVSAYINPSVQAPKSHPPPVERLRNLRQAVLADRSLKPPLCYTDDEVNRAIEWVSQLGEVLLKEYVPYRIEDLETYGSVYLPSFRPKEVHDRLDY